MSQSSEDIIKKAQEKLMFLGDAHWQQKKLSLRIQDLEAEIKQLEIDYDASKKNEQETQKAS